MKKLFAIALILSLVACGGGGGSDPVQPTQTQPGPQLLSASVLVETYGDDTLLGVKAMYPAETAPVAVAQRFLVENVGQNIRASNQAVRSTDSQQLRDGTDGQHQPWSMVMAASGAHIIVINHGLFDAWRGTAPEVYTDNLTYLVREAKKAGKLVLLDAPSPVVGVEAPLLTASSVATITQAMRDVAKAEEVPFCDEERAIKSAGMVTPLFMPDGVHPNDQLYHFKGENLGGCLMSLIRQNFK